MKKTYLFLTILGTLLPNIFVLNSDEKVLANPKFKNQDADTFINQLRSIK